jgi:Domain of unknown function (DUF309)
MSCWFAHYLSCKQIKRSMTKGERISQFMAELAGGDVVPDEKDVVNHPFYRAFFRCWNEQRYYEAHDVLEQLWLKTKSRDADYFKGLIQAAGAFVHLQKRFEHPSHAKHGRRLPPAVRLFRLAERNLSSFALRAFTRLCRSNRRIRLHHKPVVAHYRSKTAIARQIELDPNACSVEWHTSMG